MIRLILSIWLALAGLARGNNCYIELTWNITYGTISPLGVDQQGILINGHFPGPNIKATNNDNIIVNIFNNLDEPFLMHWHGIQQWKSSWQDGMPGTNCPIMPCTNYTYRFQVRDQIGTYMYYPSMGLHRAAGGFGGIRIESGHTLPVPYHEAADDYTLLVGDWYKQNHTELRKRLDGGRGLGTPKGVLINGKNLKDGGKDSPLFNMKPGLTYKYRVCNVGLKASMNLRLQNHTFRLIEMEGTHTIQNEYESLDVHPGQCYSLLVHANQGAMDYKLVASSRLMKEVLFVTAIIRYEGSAGLVSIAPLPEVPIGWAWSLNQHRSFRVNLTANAAMRLPQGASHYGAVEIDRTIKLVSSKGKVHGKLRYAINGISHVDAETPLKLAEYFGAADKVFKYNSIKDEPPEDVDDNISGMIPNVINQTFHHFVEIILENHEKSTQSWHLDGHSFFIVGSEAGKWSKDKRVIYYNLFDAMKRHTVQVFPKCWTAILTTFDNAGMWNLRSEVWERKYLGQQMYISVLSPAHLLRDERNIPDNFPLCGVVKGMPMPQPYKLMTP